MRQENLYDRYWELLGWLEYEDKPSEAIWHPLFYRYPWSLRFELGDPELDDDDAYFRVAEERAQRIWDAARSAGAKLFSQDSDGNMNSVIDSFMACGVNCFYPCEPAAGMDMVQLKKKYGKKIFFKGGIDKFALRKDKEAIRKELEYKMSEPMLGGGTVFAIDHLIPNGVSLENYWYYVNTGRELLGLPPVSGEGWERMAF